ncbi:divisome protein SepX/GlpR [Nocardia brasiliensis]|uniref:divisome protein SepX/GlpR n=1 Tax=Nocardia brasiliensis TaxID=37326 RepID=UPI002457E501|nr:gephyrin-like molybdotransferase receptor GlpR [Nocardia brasiliensis]
MPNSILWIGLVVLWVFVLFPILADRHPRIRRTTDAALATRVLHRGDSKRRTKSGPAAGHETDPNWRPRRTQRKYAHSDDAEDRMTTPADDPVTEGDPPAIAESAASHPEPERADAELADPELADPELADTELADTDDAEREDADLESADGLESDTVAAEVDAHPDDAADDDDVHDDQAQQTRPEPAAARIPPARSAVPARVELDDYDSARDDYDDDFDYVPTRRGRGGYDPEADAIARAARYTFRQRAVLGLVLTALLCGGLAVALNPLFWWGCGLSCLILVGYLTYLRRQVRIEEDIRRRRAARLSRAQQLGEPDHPRHAPASRGSMDRDTARALRRRSSLLEVDDEDPMFDHLDPFDPATARALRDRTSGDMRRAAGE